MQVSFFVKNITKNKQLKLILYWDKIIVKMNFTSWKLENTFFFLSGGLKIEDGLILLLDKK